MNSYQKALAFTLSFHVIFLCLVLLFHDQFEERVLLELTDQVEIKVSLKKTALSKPVAYSGQEAREERRPKTVTEPEILRKEIRRKSDSRPKLKRRNPQPLVSSLESSYPKARKSDVAKPRAEKYVPVSEEPVRTHPAMSGLSSGSQVGETKEPLSVPSPSIPSPTVQQKKTQPRKSG